MASNNQGSVLCVLTVCCVLTVLNPATIMVVSVTASNTQGSVLCVLCTLCVYSVLSLNSGTSSLAFRIKIDACVEDVLAHRKVESVSLRQVS